MVAWPSAVAAYHVVGHNYSRARGAYTLQLQLGVWTGLTSRHLGRSSDTA